MTIPIERYICNFIDDVPAPVAGKVDVTYYLGEVSILVTFLSRIRVFNAFFHKILGPHSISMSLLQRTFYMVRVTPILFI